MAADTAALYSAVTCLWRAVLTGGGGDAYRGATPVVVKMENPNWSISEIDADEDDESGFLSGEGGRGRRRRGKNAKQITWVLLLKAHRGRLRGRRARGRTDADADAEEEALATATAPAPPQHSRFYAFIRAFPLLSVFLLAVELGAHANGWRLAAPAALSFSALHASWVRFCTAYVALRLQLLADAGVVLFLVQSADRLVHSLGCFYIHLKRLKPKPVSPALPNAEDPDVCYYPLLHLCSIICDRI